MSDDWLNGYLLRDDYFRNVSRGLVAGAAPFSSYGKRIATGPETNILWPNGTYVLPPSTGTSLSFVSTDAQDSAAGTGIRTLEVHYLDVNLVPQSAIVALNGLTTVADAITGVRFVQCMHMLTYGTNKAAVGNISAFTGGNIYSYINAGAVRCSSSVRMVPKGKRFLVTTTVAGLVSGTAAAQGTVRVVSTHFEGHDYTADSVFMPLAELAFQDVSFGIAHPVPFALYEGAAVGMQFTVDKAATVTGTIIGILENV